MRATTPLLALFCATVVSAQAQAPLHTDVNASLKVPGNNRLTYCHDPKDYILQLHNLDLNPNPPRPGEPLHIHAAGNLTKVVKKGSIVHVQVKMGWVRFINKDFDLCDNAHEVDETCPLDKGLLIISKNVDIPEETPRQKFAIEMQAYTNDTKTELISCMKGDADFSG